jgi:putative thioredoxin
MARGYDLSGIAAAVKAPPPPAGAKYVLDADERSLEAALQLSVKHPVVIELHSPRANAQALSDDLQDLANQAQGRYLLVRVNVDEHPQIAQALGVQAVPTVIAVLAGQPLPLFQGTRPREDVQAVLEQVLQAAAQNGVTGIADPVSVDESAGPDPRFADAEAAADRGDFAAAVAEFDKLLAQNPNDAAAKAGRAQAGMLGRLVAGEPDEMLRAAIADPADVDAQVAAADVEVAGGRPEEGYARLIGVIRNTAGDERERVRLRLLELFDAVGADHPAVAKARRELMTALF